MAEVEHTCEIERPVEEVWRFVERIENWAPLVVGFQRLQLVDDRRSIWTLRGDMGVLAREVDVQADITLWDPGRRVEFTVTGLTERVEGGGEFVLDDASGPAPAPSPTAVRRDGWWRRLRSRLAAALLRRLTRRSAAVPRPAVAAPSSNGERPAGEGRSRLTFRLRVSPGGPMAPMVEVLMAPMLAPAAEDLAGGIRNVLEETGGRVP